jgi:hypothetical protein
VEKVLKEIKIVETDDGFRIEVSGEKAKEWFSSCGPGMKGFAMPLGMAMCCDVEETKKEEKKED